MTKDRQNLLVSVWEQMYSRRCRCGRCDCVSADPVELARIICLHWSIQYRELAAIATHGAAWRRALAEKWVQKAKRRRPRYLTRADLVAQANEHAAPLLAEAERQEIQARRFARAVERYQRLSRGEHPFRAPPPITNGDPR